MQSTKPMSINEVTYNNLLSFKSGKLTTFSKVIDHIINENKLLKDENLKLLKERLKYIESMEKKV